MEPLHRAAGSGGAPPFCHLFLFNPRLFFFALGHPTSRSCILCSHPSITTPLLLLLPPPPSNGAAAAEATLLSPPLGLRCVPLPLLLPPGAALCLSLWAPLLTSPAPRRVPMALSMPTVSRSRPGRDAALSGEKEENVTGSEAKADTEGGLQAVHRCMCPWVHRTKGVVFCLQSNTSDNNFNNLTVDSARPPCDGRNPFSTLLTLKCWGHCSIRCTGSSPPGRGEEEATQNHQDVPDHMLSHAG